MCPNSARWIYHADRCTLTIRVATSLDAPACRLSVEVERGGPLALLISHAVVLGVNEHDAAGHVVVDAANARVELRPAPEALVRQRYPETTFFIVSPDADQIEAIGGDGLLRADGADLADGADGADGGGSYVVVRTKPVTRFSLVLTGNILSARRAQELATAYSHGPDPDADLETASAAFWSGLRRGCLLY